MMSTPSTLYAAWVPDGETDGFYRAETEPFDGANQYTLTPERKNEMPDITLELIELWNQDPDIYFGVPYRRMASQANRIAQEKFTADLETIRAEQAGEIAARDARIVRLKGIVKMAYTTMRAVRDEIPEPAYHAIIILLGSQWAATWDAVQKESQS
jgi:hypothetical protein